MIDLKISFIQTICLSFINMLIRISILKLFSLGVQDKSSKNLHRMELTKIPKMHKEKQRCSGVFISWLGLRHACRVKARHFILELKENKFTLHVILKNYTLIFL